ncbi:MAG: Stk1 family PASTA domain-containing Ser/Thr kinase [Paenibacillaceae bacterium]|nr:Stk1 family PASTA domain-containing Ser/Thr kinase [Paenibacillaceae bacterium]
MTDQVLSGRYELLERVGGGGMALVYKAQDILLNRFVAVKVLRQQFVHDEEFIRRFRREAQAAASLSHPNIVSIYDVGQQDDVHYIVMEYVEGNTLNELIKEKAPLQVEEAVHIAGQICDALDHAHANQIVHRDIKPHNILIGKNGRVKVTDFGIARATTSSTITQTGSVVGSVHYFSPEHAKGTPAGAKSDLYSLGIVLYQMLTGRLPFLGESPISVALKHLQEKVEEPRKVNPLIPQSVENIILRAMRKSPEERYQSAEEMQHDLDTCLMPERRNERKLEFHDTEQFDAERTRVVPAIRGNADNGYADDGDEEEGRKRRGWIAPTVWAIVLLLTIGALWYGIGYVKSNFTPKDVEVPYVTGENVDVAKQKITAAGLRPEVTLETSKDVALNIVIQQDPEKMSVREGTVVKLRVSTGAEMSVMPKYVGKSINAVRLELQALGVGDTQITTTDGFSEEDPDTVLEQTPKEGDQFDPAKTKFTFKLSKGREKLKMPDLTGMTQKEAENALTLMDLKLAPNGDGVVRKPNYDTPKDRVFDQWPYKKDQDVDRGAKDIIIYISSGKPDDAVEWVYQSKPLEPKTQGKPSTFKIELTDARYEKFVYQDGLQISTAEPINIQLTLTKDKSATITYYRDGAPYNTETVTYQNYLQSLNQQSKPPAGSASPSASVTPSGSPGTTPKQSQTPTPSPSASKSPPPSAGGR